MSNDKVSEFEFAGVRFRVAPGTYPTKFDEFVLDLQGHVLPHRGFGLSIPTDDFSVPRIGADDWCTIVDQVREASAGGKTIRISCTAGRGRSGIALAIILAGLDPDWEGDPVELARRYREGAVETPEQVEYVRANSAIVRERFKQRSEQLEADLELARKHSEQQGFSRYMDGIKTGTDRTQEHYEKVLSQLADDSVEMVVEALKVAASAVDDFYKMRRRARVSLAISVVTSAVALALFLKGDK